MKKIRALMKFDLEMLLDNRLAFVYAVIFPLLFFAMSNWKNVMAQQTYDTEKLIILLTPYLSYVVMSNTLNNVVLMVYGRREDGFLKMYYFIVERRSYLLLAPEILYYFISLIECLGFTLLAMIAFHNLSPILLLQVLLIITVIYFPTCGILSLLVLLPIKPPSMTALSGGVLLLAVLTYSYTTSFLPLRVLTMFNPTILTSDLISSMLTQSVAGWGWVLGVGLVDCAIGYLCMTHLPIISKSQRV
ncbi:hypothetical protein [Levilactobacillus koreensis]|uniref:Uncharacterized protein n=1 Tax=Levilactobacillus koreensis TaxID=637971 RepID=A0AAC8ZGA3_9LACO|nr:hypothetical protein [Levilactobacillus koreensis]AKP64348.1 hypothetical protein ABN16_04620 [Levilactobacillus koreensis]